MRHPLFTRIIRLGSVVVLLLLVAAGIFTPRSASLAQDGPESRQQALEQLANVATGDVQTTLAAEVDNFSFVQALNGGVLAADKSTAPPADRAVAFLSKHGAVIGVTDPAAQLQVAQVIPDDIGMTHVRMNQMHQGLPVYGAQLIVHMNGQGITAVNGMFVPDVDVSTTPAISADVANQRALQAVAKEVHGAPLQVASTKLYVYRTGLLQGLVGENRLAYGIEVTNPVGSTGPAVREALWIDAANAAELNRVSLIHTALNRVVYSPEYDPKNPEANVQRREGGPPSAIPFVNNLYEYAGQSYNLYKNGFGRDSYDGNGITMRSVYLVNQQCPNAYWNGESTNYCPVFDADDVVSHEWGHAYTEFTHGLIYQYQSGALNESYSDIWGETVDLFNNADTMQGGSDNTKPRRQGGQRWQVGEDLTDPAAGAILRDMYDPNRPYDPNPRTTHDPARVNDKDDKEAGNNYHCATSDNGGVHTNSGVPNHAFAMICDGTKFKPNNTFNGQTINGIGFVKAAQIYWRAQALYQMPTTNFPMHADAIERSCSELIDQPINDFKTGQVAAERITAADCAEVAKAMVAVDMRTTAVQRCNYKPLLAANAPAICPDEQVVFRETWESGTFPAGWTMGGARAAAPAGNAFDPAKHKWAVTNQIPAGHTGSAAFAGNPVPDAPKGNCGTEDISGKFYMDSPPITIATANKMYMRFDHFVATEATYDGGNIWLKVGAGQFAQIPKASIKFNPYNSALAAAAPVGQNTNPNASKDAWNGANQGEASGSWGTSFVDLSTLVKNGDQIQLRWEFSMDGCGGNLGWYIDDITLYACAGGQDFTAGQPTATPTTEPNPEPTVPEATPPQGTPKPTIDTNATARPTDTTLPTGTTNPAQPTETTLPTGTTDPAQPTATGTGTSVPPTNGLFLPFVVK